MSTDLHARLLDATGPLIAGAVLSKANVNGPRAALRAAIELHAPVRQTYPADADVCDHCDELCHSETGLGCDTPDAPWPCSTIRVIADALGVKDEELIEKESE